MIPAVLLLLEGSVADVRQEKIGLDYAVHHGLLIVSLARDPVVALAVVTAGLARAVLVALEPMDGRLADLVTTVTVIFARHRNPIASRRDAMGDHQAEIIRGALARVGGDVVLVAYVLGLSVAEVKRVASAGGSDASSPARADASRGSTRRLRIVR
jgi:hypothetical protein